MTTNKQAFTVALDGINQIWSSIKLAADAWARNPRQNIKMVLVGVHPKIDAAAKDIEKNAAELGKADAKTKAILVEVARRLKEFKVSMLEVQEERLISDADSLLRTWLATCENILKYINKSVPELSKEPLFMNLLKRLAA